jgi:hypothetical protein
VDVLRRAREQGGAANERTTLQLCEARVRLVHTKSCSRLRCDHTRCSRVALLPDGCAAVAPFYGSWQAQGGRHQAFPIKPSSTDARMGSL